MTPVMNQSPRESCTRQKYNVTATPVLVIANKDGELLETYIGGMPITKHS